MKPQICLIVLLTLAVPGQAAPTESAKALFYQALKDAREGRTEKALTGFQKILDKSPADPFADDALMEQARIREESGRPARALELYQRLLKDYPDSRLVRRARARSEFIGHHLDQGEAVLVGYQAILKQGDNQAPAAAIQSMEDLLEKHPDFSLKPDGLYWIGSVLAREGQADQARQKWKQVVRLFPKHPVAAQALVGMANLAIESGDLEIAEKDLLLLSGMGDEHWKKVAQESFARIERVRFKRTVFWVAVTIWLAALVVLWVGLVLVLRSGKLEKRRLLRPPVEWLVFMPVIASLIVWAATGTHQTTRALLWMAGMIGMLVLPNGWLLRGWMPRGIKLWLWSLMLVAACLAAAVVAVGLAGMTEQVLHTLKWGPS